MKHVLALALLVPIGCGGDAEKPATQRTTEPSKPAATPLATEVAPGARRTIALDGGGSVEVLAEGQGEEARLGREVVLEYTISYVPLPPVPTAANDDSKSSAKEHDAAKNEHAEKGSSHGKHANEHHDSTVATAASTDAKPAEHATEREKDAHASTAKTHEATARTADEHAASDAKPGATETTPAARADEHAVAAQDHPAAADEHAASAPAAEHVADAAAHDAPAEHAEPVAKSDEHAASATSPAPAEHASSEASTPAPPPAQPLQPLEPVVVASTRDLASPLVARLGADGPLVRPVCDALVGLRAGTRARITLPASRAYGEDALRALGIPAAVDLTLEVQLLGVRP